ncbi:MAG: PAS domain S-box protein, partial [Deltaproteobacteria bacterium]
MASKRQKGKRSELGKSLRQIEGDEALRESEERYRLLFNEMLSGFALHEVICDENGNPCDYRFLEVNPAFEGLTGLSSEEIIGKTVLEVLPGTEPYWIEAFGKVALTGKPVRFENYSKELDRYYEVSAFSPSPGQFAVTFMDVTERKHAEEALRQAKYDLEITVKERTEELQQINARLREENQERVRTEQLLRLEQSRLDALLHLSRIGEAPLEEIAELTLGQAIALSHSKIGFLGFMNEDESVYTLHAVSKNVVKGCNVTGDPLQWHVIDAGMWADAIRGRKTLFVNDYSKPHPKKKGLPPGHPQVERFMVVPIIESDRVVAVAGVGNKASDYDKSDERQIVLLLSGMCGYLQKERSRQDLQKAYNELEESTRELAAKNVELKKSQYLLEKTFASLEEVVLLVDLADPSTRRIVAANPAARRVFGYSEEELIGRSTEMLHVNKVMFERFGSELAAALDAKGMYQCEFQMRRKDGNIILTEHTVSEVLDDSGKRTGAVSSIRDITERKAAEKKLLAYQDQLRSLSLELSLIGERERRKLAEDLHDSVAQLLVLSKFNLEDVLAKSSLGEGRTELEEVCQYLDEAIEQTRSLIFELSP